MESENWKSELNFENWIGELIMIHDYEIFVFENGWRYVGAGSADLKTIYPSLQRIAKHLNYHGLMMMQQTYVDKKICFVV